MDSRTTRSPRELVARGRRTGFRWSWLAHLAAIVGVAALVGCGQVPASPPGSPSQPGAALQPGVGETVTLTDGAVARLNGVEPNVTLGSGLPGPEAGMRLDRIDVEICAGRTDLFVDAAFWNGLGDDQQVHSAHMGVRSFYTLTMTPGSCQRGTVELAVPEGVKLEAVLLMDTSQTTAARWAVEGAAGELAPLTPVPGADPALPGSRVDLGVGGSATVHAIANVGQDLARADAELCAGSQPIPVSPRHWFLQLADHRLVPADADSSTMQAGTIEAEACDRGALDFRLPAGAAPEGVLYAYGGQFEQANWRIDQ